MAGIFGTDGVRARINTGSMRAESVVRLALAAGRWFADKTADDGRMTRPMVVADRLASPNDEERCHVSEIWGFCMHTLQFAFPLELHLKQILSAQT